MKISSIILLVTLVLMVVAMYATNIVLKKQYDKIDKTDLYWTYDKILEQPFKYLKLEGGNITNIAFEQSKNPSVRIYNNWDGFKNKKITAAVRNDTLFIKMSNGVKDIYEKRYMGWNTMVRIFAPELIAVDGFNTNFGLFKLKQKNINITLSGKSTLEVESLIHDLDTVNVNQRDSSAVVIEMSPELKGTENISDGDLAVKPDMNHRMVQVEPAGSVVKPSSWETVRIKRINAKLEGVSILDVGHAQIDSINLHITDTSAIILSGQGLRKFNK